MKSLFALIASFILFANVLSAQQTLKGTVIDKQSEMPLIGATVAIVNSDPTIGTTTDVDGNFSIPEVPYGRYSIAISYLGFEGITLPNVEVTAGKEVYLEIGLEESVEKLDEVVVTAAVQKDRAQNELATISARTFSVEEVNRYSGGRSDIGRLVSNFAGVSTADDSRNDIVIRGNSPTGVLWRLEGIPIPNPNHFSTLGTTGGPVSALNPNMIKNSDFMTSAFPAEYGNALAGVFDLGFRTGNRDKHEFMIQMAAVSGIEAMAEGPINKAKGSSYLVTGRYSFLGFAQGIGLPIGTNATPDYRDLSFNINFGNGKAGKFSLFGIGGSSDISFLHDQVDETDLFAANDEDAFAESRFGVVGLKHNLIL
ncbi:MAG: carboxypeptidase-like regulatory domain-containing protein, partial [Bacteroidota bacterium]